MKTVFFRLLKSVLPYHKWIMLSALLGFLTVGSGIGLLMTSAFIISKAALHPSIAELQIGIVGVRFFGIARGIFRYLERLLSHDLTFKLLAEFRVWFYRSILPHAPARLMKYRSADLLTRIVNDVESLQHIFIRVLYPPVVAVLIAFLMWLLLGMFHLHFALVTVFFLFVSGLIVPLLTLLLSRKPSEQLIGTRRELNELIADGVEGMPEILVYNQEARYESRLADVNNRYKFLQERLALISGFHESASGFLMNFTVLLLFYLAAPLVNQGVMDGIYLAVITLGIITAFEAVIPMPAAFQHLRESTAAGERLYEFTGEPEPDENPPADMLPVTPYDLRIDSLTFRYEDDGSPALRDLSLELPVGNRLAVVGPSGAGKSSIANILLGFWKHWQGSVRLGGTDYQALSGEKIRSFYTVVSQQSHIFNETIRYNLRLADREADESQLWEALNFAGLKSFVEQLPQKLETFVGSMGSRLSGGQAQRLALARAYLKQAPIWILDEATSNLDIENEERLLNNILQLGRDRSIIMLTHRLTGLEYMDEIIVLGKGSIVERGSFQELIRRKDYFYHSRLEQNEERLLEALRS